MKNPKPKLGKKRKITLGCWVVPIHHSKKWTAGRVIGMSRLDLDTPDAPGPLLKVRDLFSGELIETFPMSVRKLVVQGECHLCGKKWPDEMEEECDSKKQCMACHQPLSWKRMLIVWWWARKTRKRIKEENQRRRS